MLTKQQFIDGQWIEGDARALTSINPATNEPVWSGPSASASLVNTAVAAARKAFPAWRATSLDDRIAATRRFAEALESNRPRLVEIICAETGKPRWEAGGEVGAMIGKVSLSVDAYHERRAIVEKAMTDATAFTRYQPHGVCAVLGPFNLPGHLPNGHIVPALIAGNTVVFKPSEKTPAVGEVMMDIWRESGLPAGVVNLVQGERQTGAALVEHPGVDGIFFTGGCGAGLAIQNALLQQPQKIVALEMGGNNPLVVHGITDIDAAAIIVVQSAYMTAGQRCTCARRLILSDEAVAGPLLDRVAHLIDNLRIGPPTLEPEPFCGPMISEAAATALLSAQSDLIARGGKSLVTAQRIGEGGALVRPGLIDVTDMTDRGDSEHFGPLLQVIRVDDFDAAIAEANNTRFGLSAALLCNDRAKFDRFVREVRAGVINWNRPTNGASGAMPFGGVGISGNHRPAGYWSADYCSYPVASVESPQLAVPRQLPIGLSL